MRAANVFLASCTAIFLPHVPQSDCIDTFDDDRDCSQLKFLRSRGRNKYEAHHARRNGTGQIICLVKLHDKRNNEQQQQMETDEGVPSTL